MTWTVIPTHSIVSEVVAAGGVPLAEVETLHRTVDMKGLTNELRSGACLINTEPNLQVLIVEKVPRSTEYGSHD